MKQRKRIAFQGEPGANSHIACDEAYPGYEPLPCPTFEDAFAAVRTGRAKLGMIPIDNSVAGRVADIHHLMPRSGLHIVGEWFLPVQHQLMAPRGATLRTIKTVESHVHALGQCRNIIRKLRVKAVVAADTAGAAREVAEAGDISRAALATKLAAKIYGLQILKKDVADAKHNTTRFVVLAREPKWASRKEQRVMTTFVFEVRNIPAALYKALGRLRHQRRQHDQAGELHGGRQLCRDPVLCRCAGSPQASRAGTGAGRAGVRLAAEVAENSRRLPGARIPRDVKIEHNAVRGPLAFEQFMLKRNQQTRVRRRAPAQLRNAGDE